MSCRGRILWCWAPACGWPDTLGCELGQGFFFAKPLGAEDWAGLLAADRIAGGRPAVDITRVEAPGKKRSRSRKAA